MFSVAPSLFYSYILRYEVKNLLKFYEAPLFYVTFVKYILVNNICKIYINESIKIWWDICWDSRKS